MNEKQFDYIMRKLYDDLCCAVDNHEFYTKDGNGEEVTVVTSNDMYERLKFYFSKLIDIIY